MTGDEGDFWRDILDCKKGQREKEGIECPTCKQNLPKANPTILWSGKPKCKICGTTWESLQAKKEHKMPLQITGGTLPKSMCVVCGSRECGLIRDPKRNMGYICASCLFKERDLLEGYSQDAAAKNKNLLVQTQSLLKKNQKLRRELKLLKEQTEDKRFEG